MVDGNRLGFLPRRHHEYQWKIYSKQNILLAEQLWIRVLAFSPADQQAIKAIKRLALLAVPEAPNTIIQTPLPESVDEADDSEDPHIRAIRRQHELDVLKTNLEIKRIDADFFKAQQEYEFESRLIDAGLQGFMAAMQGEQQPERSKKTSFPKNAIQTFEFDVVTVDDQGREINRQQKQSQVYVEDLGNGVQLEMVLIPGGTFQMGSPYGIGDSNERPQHSVIVQPFLMGKYPITQAQWKTIAAWRKISRELIVSPSSFEGDKHPVEQVLWHDAMEFCDRLSCKTGREYRLPSEAEWEYACRAETPTPFHFGETITTVLSNYNGKPFASEAEGAYRKQTTEVGSFQPNNFGLYDMHGNIWEWCLDHWHENYIGSPTDGSAWIANGDSNRRLVRGGSWNVNPWDCRSATRYFYNPAYRNADIGFRVVCLAPRTL